MTDATVTQPAPRRLRPVLLVMAAVVALVLLLLALPMPVRSERADTVEQLMQAAKADDQVVFNALTVPLPEFYPLFDVTDRLDTRNLREMIGACRVLGMYDGIDTVAVQFDCSRDANGQFFLDFTFEGDKVSAVFFPELGRSVRSPIGRDIEERFVNFLNWARYAL